MTPFFLRHLVPELFPRMWRMFSVKTKMKMLKKAAKGKKFAGGHELTEALIVEWANQKEVP